MKPAHVTQALNETLHGFRKIFLGVLLLSGLINILALTGAIYMLQVYDRVLTSHSVPTLVVLSILVAGLYALQGILDVLRGQVLIRLGSRFDRRISPLAHNAVSRLAVRGVSSTDSVQPMRDVDTVRSFLGGQGPVAIVDMPWTPVYLVFVSLLHPVLGLVTTGGLLVLVALNIVNGRVSNKLNHQLVVAANRRNAVADAHARNAEAILAMGMGQQAAVRLAAEHSAYLSLHERLSDVTGGLSGSSKVFRLFLQSAILGFGAYLTLQGEMSAGAIIAASITSSRALAPVESAISHWRQFVAARQSYSRLQKTLDALPQRTSTLSLPAPTQTLSVEAVSVAVPGTQRIILNAISFSVSAGQALAVIGPSGSGKSTLARAIVSVWPLARGTVRLDGVASEHWDGSAFGAHIGYLPQAVELFDVTVAENIARLQQQPTSAAIITAARDAGVHELILRLPDGYETRLGPNGSALSAGQRQRIALARALYGRPFLVVLDEPNANLDSDGDEALSAAIAGIRTRGGIAIIIAHRPSTLASVDHVAVLGGGQLKAFGLKDEVLRKALQPQSAATPRATSTKEKLS